jgi:hypothetical protein
MSVGHVFYIFEQEDVTVVSGGVVAAVSMAAAL